MPSLLEQIPNTVRKHWHEKITVANTDTQIITVSWTVPANAVGYLEKVMISNQNTSATAVRFYDWDSVSSGTKPAARGTILNPIIPPINVAAGAQVILGYDLCPNPDLVSGLVAQATVAGNGADAGATGAVYVFAQWVEIEN